MDSSWGYLNILWVFQCFPVANKWIHEHGQEFLHPCSLNPDEWDGWITGPLQARDPCLHNWKACREKVEARKVSLQAQDWESLHLWLELVAPWGPEVYSTLLQRTWTAQGWEVSWRTSGGNWQSAPQAKCSLAHAGQLLPIERGLCLRTQGWFQLTLQGSVPPESLNMDPLPTLGLLSGLSLQINTTELVQTSYFSSFFTDTCRGRNDRKVL